MGWDCLGERGRRILEAAARPREIAEVYLKRTWWKQAVRQEGVLTTESTGLEVGCGIRIFLPDGRWAHAHCSDPGPDGIRRTLETARELAVVCPAPGREIRLPGKPRFSVTPEFRPPPDEGAAFLEALEEAARGAEPAVVSIPLALCSDGVTEVWIGNSRGFQGSYLRVLRHVVLGVLCRGGGDTTYHRWAAAEPGSLSAEEIGREAALRGTLPLRTSSKTVGRVPILLHPAVGARLVQILSLSFLGRRTTFRIGDRAGSPQFQLIDDGALPGGIGSAPFDGEGWPTSRKVLVRDGIVELQIGDRDEGVRDGNRPFGNRVRDSYREPPRISPTNLFISEGTKSSEELLRDAKGGVLVLNLEPSSSASFRSGRFAFGFSGCALGGDGIAGGIRSAVLTGDRDRFLKGIRTRGSDLRFYPMDGSFGSPTLLLEGLSILDGISGPDLA